MEFESTCLLIQNSDTNVPWSPRFSQGLHLEVTQHALTMRRVANLIIATEKFKSTGKCAIGTEFRDEDLLSVLLEAFEEQTVLLVEAAAPAFMKDSSFVCDINDTDNKSLIQEVMDLSATLLQGGNESRKVQLKLSTYFTQVPSETPGRPVVLSIKGSDLFLCCSESGNKPTLQLQEMNEDDLKTIGSQSDLVRFLFYRHDTGTDISTLESALFKDWFISTAKEEDNIVDMCQRLPLNRIITFNFQKTS